MVSNFKSNEYFKTYVCIIFSGESSFTTSSFNNLKLGITIGLLEKIHQSVIGSKTVLIVVILIICHLKFQNLITSPILYFFKIIVLQTKEAIK